MWGMQPAHPAAFEAYVAPARAHPQLWRVAVGLVLIVALHLATTLVALALMRPGAVPLGPGSMVIILFSFAGLGLGTWAAVRLLHRRSLASLIGPGRRAWRHFLLGVAVIGGLHAAAFGFSATQLDLEPGLAPTVWLMWLPLALLGLAVQTGAEELVFRGYLQQQLAARFASPLVWMVLPSIAFALLHYSPEEMGPNTWIVVAVTGAFGLVAADLTARSGTLGLAWGLHFANNIFALTLVAPVGPLSGLALYTTPFSFDDPGMMRLMLLGDVALLGVVWGICRLALRRG